MRRPRPTRNPAQHRQRGAPVRRHADPAAPRPPAGIPHRRKSLRRAGLDYWRHVEVHHHANFADALAGSGEGPVLLFSARAGPLYTEAPYAARRAARLRPRDLGAPPEDPRRLPAERLSHSHLGTGAKPQPFHGGGHRGIRGVPSSRRVSPGGGTRGGEPGRVPHGHRRPGGLPRGGFPAGTNIRSPLRRGEKTSLRRLFLLRLVFRRALRLLPGPRLNFVSLS